MKSLMTAAVALLILGGAPASADHASYNRGDGAVSTGGRHHLGAQDLYPRQARVLVTPHSARFRVLVTPNLVPRPAAMVTAAGAGRAHCASLGKSAVRLKKVRRHADEDIAAWAMDFVCR